MCRLYIGDIFQPSGCTLDACLLFLGGVYALLGGFMPLSATTSLVAWLPSRDHGATETKIPSISEWTSLEVAYLTRWI